MTGCYGAKVLTTEAALAKVQTIMQQITSEVAKDERERMREARNAELREALQEADELDRKAHDEGVGGWLSGGLTIAGGALVIGNHVRVGSSAQQKPDTSGPDRAAGSGNASPSTDSGGAQAIDSNRISGTEENDAGDDCVSADSASRLSIDSTGVDAVGNTLSKMADPAASIMGAHASHHEAASRRAAAMSRAHGDDANDAKAAFEAAQRAAESCSSVYRTMLDSYHQSMMTILARR